MNSRLAYLLRKYIDRDISDEERAELFAAIRDERNAGFFRDAIDRDFEAGEEGIWNKEEIYEEIPGKNGIAAPVRKPWRRLTAWGAVAAMLLAAVLLWVPGREERKLYLSGKAVLSDPQGHRTYRQNERIALPDGSVVLLEPHSELVALYRDGAFTREVVLKGRAFFDIQPDPGATFTVYTGKISTKVLGTAFHISASAGKTEVTVTRGVVEVSGVDKVYGKLKAKEQLTVNEPTKESSFQTLSDLEIETFSADLLPLIFEESTLGEVFRKVGERFDTTILLENRELGKCRISADFTHGESLDDILDLICQMRHASFRKTGSGIVIEGGKLCN